MAGFKMSFSGVTNDVVTPGNYICTLTGVKFNEASQSSGKPYIAAEFTIVSDEDENTQFAGRKVFRNFSLQSQSLFALKGAMIALDADPEIFESEEEFDIVEYLKENLIGNQAILTITNEDYQGEPRARVGKIRSVQTVGSF
jgi:hypothetical protein